MAYRTAREAMRSHEAAIDAAEAVYFEAHPRGRGRQAGSIGARQ
jgi:hypothetical protein